MIFSCHDIGPHASLSDEKVFDQKKRLPELQIMLEECKNTEFASFSKNPLTTTFTVDSAVMKGHRSCLVKDPSYEKRLSSFHPIEGDDGVVFILKGDWEENLSDQNIAKKSYRNCIGDLMFKLRKKNVLRKGRFQCELGLTKILISWENKEMDFSRNATFNRVRRDRSKDSSSIPEHFSDISEEPNSPVLIID